MNANSKLFGDFSFCVTHFGEILFYWQISLRKLSDVKIMKKSSFQMMSMAACCPDMGEPHISGYQEEDY